MNEQGSQGSNDPQQLDSNMPDHDDDGPYEPDSRADVDPRPLAMRPQKWKAGKKLRQKNAQGILQYDVSIVSARYDNERRSWMYTLKDYRNQLIAGETKETMLG